MAEEVLGAIRAKGITGLLGETAGLFGARSLKAFAPSPGIRVAVAVSRGIEISDALLRERSRMPRIPGIPGPYRLFFYSFDCAEPMHVHARRDNQHAKFWLASVRLAWNDGFSEHELHKISRLILEHEGTIIEAWYEHCGHR